MEAYFDTGRKDHGRYFDDSMLDPDLGKITVVRVWHKGYIDGIEVQYGSKSHGQRIGLKRDHETKVSELLLADDEHITAVHGRSGWWLDQLNFVTSKGRTMNTGTSMGGHPFVFEVPGKVVGFFRYEVSEYVDYFGAAFEAAKKSGKWGSESL
eukprot:TRINITY_DN2476_c0_g2_i3.p1 TRINITY_DN2476_c0_g2~~TRINITY_DN2476_c0_g2_i3.p1  ORF type:complete len:153 (+),score=43.85 TRINITY_DN2476_c0_g2_i3:76-534(+)